VRVGANEAESGKRRVREDTGKTKARSQLRAVGKKKRHEDARGADRVNVRNAPHGSGCGM